MLRSDSVQDIVYGITVVTVSTGLILFSWKYARQDKFALSIILLSIAGLVLRFYTASDFFLHEWDERYHALVAKNLINNPFTPVLYENPIMPYNYTNWDGNYIWLHKQPIPLWSMATSMSVFGINEIALRLPSIILSTIGIWMTYFIGKHLFNKNVGYLAAFLFTINGLIIELGAGRIATDHIDIFFLFFIEAAIVFTIIYSRRKSSIYNILVGIMIGLAILTKWLPALIVLPIWLVIVFNSQNFSRKQMVLQFLVLISIITVVALPWQLYIYSEFPQEAKWESLARLKHLTEALEGRSGPFYFFFEKIRINYGEFIYLPLFWFLWMTVKNWKESKYLVPVIWFLVPFFFFSFAATKMQGYILFTSPALFIMTGHFYFQLKDKIKEKSRFNWVIYLALASIIILPVRYSLERVKPFNNSNKNPEWAENLRNLNSLEIEDGILFNCDRYVEAMFYTDLISYAHVPTIEQIEGLQKQGYSILINDNDQVSDQVRSLENIEWVFIE